jgi:hypothetical protein
MSYNGYTNWARWNVALWINNDEGLYNLAVDMLEQYGSKTKAADAILESLHELGITHTPDGARYSRAAIIETLRYWE